MQAFSLTMVLNFNYTGSICFYKYNVVKNSDMERYIVLTMLQRRTILANKGASLTQSGDNAEQYIPTIVWADINVK